MITSLCLRRFKRFRELSLPLRSLTVLTGANCTGKTTIIQALLLARQASQEVANVVQLNGPYGLALGEGVDVLFREAEEPSVALARDRVHFLYDSDRDRIIVGIFTTHCYLPD